MFCHACSRFGVLALLTDTLLVKEERLKMSNDGLNFDSYSTKGQVSGHPGICVSVSDTAGQLNYYLLHRSPETHSREKKTFPPLLEAGSCGWVD